MEVLITFIILIVMILLLIFETYDPLKIFAMVVAVFLALGYITVDEAIMGFSNKGVLSVAILFIVAGAVEKSAVFQRMTRFNSVKYGKFNPIKLFATITGLSAFLNNTPIVSLFIPIVKKISLRTGVSESKLLIPISYLSLLGGVLTLIGTSTNLVISGLLEDLGMDSLGFFELTRVSFPSVIIGFLYIYFFHMRRLPDNSKALEGGFKQMNEHLVRFVVGNSSIVGKSVQDANLRALSGVYLVEIERNGMQVFPVTPDEIILKNDLLIFAGQTDQIDELKSIDNLLLETDHQYQTNYFNHDNSVIVEAVVTQPIGKPGLSIKELKFRKKYNAVVIGVIRNGERIQAKLGSIKPKLGDIFLMIVEKGSTGFIEKDPALTVINREERRQLDTGLKSVVPVITFVGIILSALLLNLNILHTAVIGVAILLLMNNLQIKDALNMIEYKTIILIASSFAIGKALINTGTAAFIADFLEPCIIGLHPILLMLLIFVLTNSFTMVITNNAAAIIALPIVLEIVSVTNYDARPFILITAIAASASFLSPYGYQTNTMIYGAGGYRFRDFIHFGYPLTLIMMLVSSVTAYTIFL